jgi:hypothetical protein
MYSVLAILLTFVVIVSEANADGDYVIFQVRTTVEPVIQFDTIRTTLYEQGSGRLVGSIDHRAQPGRDYGLGARVAEFELDDPASGEFRGTVTMLLAGRVVTERPVRYSPGRHGHPHDWYSGYPNGFWVITVLLVPEDLDPVVLVEQVTKEATLVVDSDGNGSISACDTVRYDVSFPASHDVVHGSVFRDELTPDVDLLTGTVSTTHGTVFRGNFPRDNDIEVRFGVVPIDELVTVSYLVRIDPRIVNQGLTTLKLRGSSFEYDVPTDDPVTPAVNDPTVISLGCDPQGDPLPNPKTVNLFPDEIPQNILATIEFSGANLGTHAGPPTLTVNGFTVVTEILSQGNNLTEVVRARLTAEQTMQAGMVPFTLTPADPQLPDLNGVIAIRSAAGITGQITESLNDEITNRIGEVLSDGLQSFQAARIQGHADPESCEQLKSELRSDLRRTSEYASLQIISFGNSALQQATAANGTQEDLEAISNTVGDGLDLLGEMMGELMDNARKGKSKGKNKGKRKGNGKDNKGKKNGHGLICP